jgi:hypothetical protein
MNRHVNSYQQKDLRRTSLARREQEALPNMVIRQPDIGEAYKCTAILSATC